MSQCTVSADIMVRVILLHVLHHDESRLRIISQLRLDSGLVSITEEVWPRKGQGGAIWCRKVLLDVMEDIIWQVLEESLYSQLECQKCFQVDIPIG